MVEDLTERRHRRGVVDRLSRRGRELRPRAPAQPGQVAVRRRAAERPDRPGRRTACSALTGAEERRRQCWPSCSTATERHRRRHPGRRDPPGDAGRCGGAEPSLGRRRRSRRSSRTPRVRGRLRRHAGRRPRRTIAARRAQLGSSLDDGRPPVIEAQGLTKRFGDFTAADDITFDDPARRDLRPARAERRRQVDHLQDAVRAAEPTAGDGRGRRASTCASRRGRSAQPARLHGAEVLALRRSQRAPEPRLLRRRLWARRQAARRERSTLMAEIFELRGRSSTSMPARTCRSASSSGWRWPAR